MQQAVTSDQRNLAVLAHLGSYLGVFLPYIGPFLIPAGILIARRDEPWLRHHAMEAVNFNISVWIWVTILGAASAFLIGIPFLLAYLLWALIVPIPAALSAARGEHTRYGFTLRFLS